MIVTCETAGRARLCRAYQRPKSAGKRYARSRRRGYTLVFFALILFALMALAALVIDIGFARLAQRQMQTAVDGAVAEGLRERFGADETEEERRHRVRDLVSWTFDDDLNVGNGDAIGFGAGPLIGLEGGVGDEDLGGGRQIVLPETPFYKPQLQTNMANQTHGDMVAGSYEYQARPVEIEDYSRTDFDPSANDPDAFLVRMRRTNDFENLDNATNISSSGPSIPFLFGLGSLLPATDPSQGYAPRIHGMTVRATAIAQARPALSVGLWSGDVAAGQRELPGLFPLALTVPFWNGMPSEMPIQLSVAMNAVDMDMDLLDGTMTPVGRFFATSVEGLRTELEADQRPQVITRTIPLGVAPGTVIGQGFVPLYLETPSTDCPDLPTNRALGFGFVGIQANGSIVTITRLATTQVAENTSAVVRQQLSESDVLVLQEVLACYRDAENAPLDGIPRQPLLAPALVR